MAIFRGFLVAAMDVFGAEPKHQRKAKGESVTFT